MHHAVNRRKKNGAKIKSIGNEIRAYEISYMHIMHIGIIMNLANAPLV